MISKEEISGWFRTLQDSICKALAAEDGIGKFEEDNWQREGGGGGRTRILQNGNVIEKGGVNFSEVYGDAPSFLAKTNTGFYATGVSIVMHPKNPMVPIIHMNVRYIEVGDDKWFGGGIDLTPHYVNEEDAQYFHRTLKNVCDQYHHTYYPEFKKWADDYFFITHRNETRGVGGIFFDHLKAPPPPEGGSSPEDESAGYKTADPLMYGLLKEFVKNHRSVPTEAENAFWQLARRKNLEGYKFRRQHIIGAYIADFVCLKEKLIVEIDGLIHQLPDNIQSDEFRTNWLKEKGYRVIRFTNEEVLVDPDAVAAKTLAELQSPPSGGRGAVFDFVKDIGLAFAPIYVLLMKKNNAIAYTEKEKQWQYLRRGRYAEFNLVYDRGTKFGLETNGRTESILMSLPPQANWAYNHKPEKGSAEEKTLRYLKKGISWLED